MALAISIAVFVIVVGMVTLFGYRRYVVAGRMYANLEPSTAATPLAISPAAPETHFISRAAEFIGGKLPPSDSVASKLQRKLLAAGYREKNSITILYGLKLMLMAGTGLLMLFFAAGSTSGPVLRIATVAIGILAGFALPDYFLAKRIKRRQKKLRKALPDALDLFVVCAEAGLTIDRCFRNVSRQLDIVHPELCSEFSFVTTEISAGLRRKEALENLADRTQETEVRKFVNVVVQADRFGTSMADALRTHAEYLRVRRRQEAEEAASKVGVKMIFPIFFFIMPCMILVTIGPAAVTIARQLTGLFTGAR